MDESLDRAAARVLGDKAGLRDAYLEQLYTFGDPKRDPRTRVLFAPDQGHLEMALDDREDRDVHGHGRAVERRGVVGGEELLLLAARGCFALRHVSTPLDANSIYAFYI